LKITPIAKDIKQVINKNINNKKNTVKIKPIKNYSDYIKEYGLK
jgi:hypothetical protein